jgi:integrase
VPKKNPKKKQISMDFGEKLLNEAEKVNDSFYLFVLLLKQLGLRLNELRLLKREHITMEDGIL